MGKNPEPVITMTPAELAAFVDARIAERDAKATSDAELAKAPPVERAPLARVQAPPPDPELDAALLAIFDSESADNWAPSKDPRDTMPASKLENTVRRVYSEINAGHANKRLKEMYESWRSQPATGWATFDHDLERQALGAYIARLDQVRRTPPVDELVAEKMPRGLR